MADLSPFRQRNNIHNCQNDKIKDSNVLQMKSCVESKELHYYLRNFYPNSIYSKQNAIEIRLDLTTRGTGRKTQITSHVTCRNSCYN